jgi:hypothetical protein
MFRELHNKLGENGQALTVLSLLHGPPLAGPESGDISGSLRDVSQRLRDLAGGDETELVNMYSVYPNDGGSLEFLALELVPLGQAIQRINQLNGGRDDAPTVLSVVDQSDQDSDDGAPDGPADGVGGVDGADGPHRAGSQALTRLREAIRGLFNRAGENGQPLTVLSLLSEPTKDRPSSLTPEK